MISPDGKAFIYIAETEQGHQLVKTNVDDLAKQRLLTSSKPLVSPVWLNDNSVAYGQCEQGMCQIYRHHLPTNETQLLIENASPITALNVNVVEHILLIATITKGQRSFELFDLNSNKPIVLNKPIVGQYPIIDSVYKRAYLLTRSAQGHPKLQRYDIDKEKLENIPIKFDRVFALGAKAKGEILVSARREGESGIWALNTDTNSLSKVITAAPGQVFSDLAYHQPNKLLLHKQHRRNIDIGFEGIGQDFGNVNSDLIDMNAVYLDKHKQLIFVSNRTGFYELWSSKLGQLIKLTHLKSDVIERPIVNDTQDKLAFTSTELNNTILRILATNTGEIVATHKLADSIHLLSWERGDGAIFYSTSKHGRYSIYRYDFDKQQSIPVQLNAGLLYHQNTQGLEYYGQISSASLMEKNASGEVKLITKLPDSAQPIRPHQATIIEGVLYYVDNQGEEKTIVGYSINGDMEKHLPTMSQNAYVTQIGKDKTFFVIYDELVNIERQLVLTQFD